MALDLFNPLVYPGELLEGFVEEVFPLSDVKSGPIEFMIPGDANFIDLSATMLYIQVALLNPDGTAQSDSKEGAFVNNAMHSMFSDILVKIGDTIVEGGDQTYPYKAYLDTVFAYSEESMKKQLQAAGFYKDDAAKMDGEDNVGFVTRKELTTGSKVAEFYGKPMLSIFQQKRYLLNHTRMAIKLIKSKPEFCVMSLQDAKPKFEIKSAALYIRKIVPHPLITDSIEKELAANRVVTYPVNHAEIFYLFSKEKVGKVMHDQLFYSRVPKTIVVGMIDNGALNGDYKKNPFNFKPFDLASIELRVNGMSKPSLPLKTNFRDGSNVRAYMSIYEALNIIGRDGYLPFSYSDWQSGYTFFVFNLTPDRTGRAQIPDQRAAIRLDMAFDPPPTTPVTIVMYAVFDSNIFITSDGVVTTDYSM